jgi:hypothetical protein
MYKYFIFFFVLYTSLDASAKLDSLIRAGVLQSYNFEFERSSLTFNEIISRYPEQPEGYFYLSQNHLWFFLGSRDEGELRTFEKFTELSVQKCESIISDSGKSAYYIELLGNLSLQNAIAEAFDGSTLNAFFSTKSAYNYFEESLEIDSSNYKSYLGIGLLEYALSYVPGMFKWAVDLSGLGRDKEKGFKYISLAAKYSKDPISKTECMFHKAKMLAEYKGDSDSSAFILQELVEKFPRNLLFKYQLALALIDNRELAKASENLKYITGNPDKRFNQTVAYSYFLSAELLFRSNNFTDAIIQYEIFLENSTGFEYAGITYYNIALSYLMIGDSLNAGKNLVLARNGNSDISDDLYAERRSELIYNRLPGENQKKIISARNFLYSGEYAEAIKVLEADMILPDQDDRIERLLILAESYIYRKNYDRAEKCLTSVDVSKIENEFWFKPYFYYLSCRNKIEMKLYGKAKEDLQSAIDTNEYDFKEKITAKLNYLKDRISALNK